MSIHAIPTGALPPGGTSEVSYTAGTPPTVRPAGLQAPVPGGAARWKEAKGGGAGKGRRAEEPPPWSRCGAVVGAAALTPDTGPIPAGAHAVISTARTTTADQRATAMPPRRHPPILFIRAQHPREPPTNRCDPGRARPLDPGGQRSRGTRRGGHAQQSHLLTWTPPSPDKDHHRSDGARNQPHPPPGGPCQRLCSPVLSVRGPTMRNCWRPAPHSYCGQRRTTAPQHHHPP